MSGEKREIAELLTSTLHSAGVASTTDVDLVCSLLEIPKDSAHGDLAFPCFTLAKDLKKAPALIAQDLSKAITDTQQIPVAITEVKPTGPYINFVLNKSAIAADIIPALLDGSFLTPRSKQSDKVMVEYSQPNTHKAFHVGHIRSAALGDTLVRLLEWSGYEVVATNYLGDEGTHVARCLWYLKNVYRGEIPETNRGEFLGSLYTRATDLLDLTAYTQHPFPGAVTARVTTITDHPEEKKWTVVDLQTLTGTKQVVCGISGFSVGDIVAYAPPGIQVSGKLVTSVEKKGICSDGMICSEAEISLSTNNDKIAVFNSKIPVGTELTEVGRKPDKTPTDKTVLEHVNSLLAEVSAVLQALENEDPDMVALWQETKDWSIQEYYEIYDWLNCRFDHYFTESECRESSKNLVLDYLKRGIFQKSEGAVGVDLSRYDLGFCLLLKSDGTALYATRDLELARVKFEEFNIDRSIYVVDSGQSLHFQQVFKCLELMGYEKAHQCYHHAFAQVVRPDGKMSSRKGNVILFSELKNRLLTKIISEYLDKYRDSWTDQEIDDAAYKISLATIRYGMLNQDNNSQIIFDLDEWTARSGNTGPYLMYAYARIRSILRDAPEQTDVEPDWSLLDHSSEIDLLMHLKGYHDLLLRASDSHSPHLLCNYVYELCKKFSRFYSECSVLRADSDAIRATRIRFIEAVGENLKHGLILLGIHTIERM